MSTRQEDDKKFQILKLVHDTHRKEIAFHREALDRVFQWTTSLLLAIGGGLIVIGPKISTSYGIGGPLLITVAVGVICFFAIKLTNGNAKDINTNAKIVVKTDRLLKLFEPNYFKNDEAIYPEDWMMWGKERDAAKYRSYNIRLIIVFMVSILILIWMDLIRALFQ